MYQEHYVLIIFNKGLNSYFWKCKCRCLLSKTRLVNHVSSFGFVFYFFATCTLSFCVHVRWLGHRTSFIEIKVRLSMSFSSLLSSPPFSPSLSASQTTLVIMNSRRSSWVTSFSRRNHRHGPVANAANFAVKSFHG